MITPSQAGMPPTGEAVLIVYPFCLDHVGHGNIQRVLGLSRYLAAAGFAVDLVYQGSARLEPVVSQYAAFRRVDRAISGLPEDAEADARWAQEVTAFYAEYELPPMPMRPSAALARLARARLDAAPYRAVIATYAWTAPIFARWADSPSPQRVCDVQDIIHEHAESARRATGTSSSFSLAAETEMFLWRHWDTLLAISAHDAAQIGLATSPQSQTLTQPRILTVGHASAIAADIAVGDDDVALYVASDNAANVHAVRWLLDEVWPLVTQARPAARLRMAGHICRAFDETMRARPGVELLGFRDDVSADLAACGVVVAPYLFGSGLKIKVVEAACAGKAIVTTPAGLAGSGLIAGQAAEVEQEPRGFAEALTHLLADRRRRKAFATIALVQARTLFSADACYGETARVIGSARGRHTAALDTDDRSTEPAGLPTGVRR